MSTAKHAPTPWHHTGRPNALGEYTIFSGPHEGLDNQVCMVKDLATAEFLVRAANRHDELVSEHDQTISDMRGLLAALDGEDVETAKEIAAAVANRCGAALAQARADHAT